MNQKLFKGHTYTWCKPFTRIRHQWELRSAHGGITFWAMDISVSPTCGLELHSIYQQGENPPDHINCPVTGGRCWHDGTSMYATDALWPLIEPYLKDGDHETIFRILEREAEKLKEYRP